jgi:hypothetical protein
MAGTLLADTLNTSTGVFSTNNAYNGIAKAWVYFSLTGGTSTVYKSFNVSSVTYVSTGTATVNFTTALTDANYAVAGASSWDSGNNIVAGTIGIGGTTTKTSSACGVSTQGSAGTVLQATRACVVFFD